LSKKVWIGVRSWTPISNGNRDLRAGSASNPYAKQHADLVGVCLAPDDLGLQALIALASMRLQECQIAPGLYAAPPAAVVKAVTLACRAHRRKSGIAAVVRRVLRPLRRAVRSLRRIDAMQTPSV